MEKQKLQSKLLIDVLEQNEHYYFIHLRYVVKKFMSEDTKIRNQIIVQLLWWSYKKSFKHDYLFGFRLKFARL